MTNDSDKLAQGRLRRGAQLAAGLSPESARLITTLVSSGMRSPEKAAELARRRHVKLADAAVEVLGSLRGGAMKVGQLASFVDADVLPPEYRDVYRERLSALRAGAPAMSFRRVRPVLDEDLDAPIESIFEDFDEDAVAAASVGQVHRATLPGGRQVAVKVQYPGVAEAIRSDLGLASIGVQLARLIAPGVEPEVVMGELRERIMEELDYELEAAQQRFFARAYREHPFIFVPAVDTSLTRRRVLVSDWVDGRSFEEILTLSQQDRDRVGEILYRFFIGSLHRLGRFQTDPHPGNYLLRDDKSLAFLDFGSVRHVDPDELQLGVRGLLAMQHRDASELRDVLDRQGYLRDREQTDPDMLLELGRQTADWFIEDRELRITREYVAQLIATTANPGVSIKTFRVLRVPASEIMFRRVVTGVLAVLGQLEAKANWHRIACEWWHGAAPATALGEAEHRHFAK